MSSGSSEPTTVMPSSDQSVGDSNECYVRADPTDLRDVPPDRYYIVTAVEGYFPDIQVCEEWSEVLETLSRFRSGPAGFVYVFRGVRLQTYGIQGVMHIDTIVDHDGTDKLSICAVDARPERVIPSPYFLNAGHMERDEDDAEQSDTDDDQSEDDPVQQEPIVQRRMELHNVRQAGEARRRSQSE